MREYTLILEHKNKFRNNIEFINVLKRFNQTHDTYKLTVYF